MLYTDTFLFRSILTLSSDVNDCNFLNFILTLIVFIVQLYVNTPESVSNMQCTSLYLYARLYQRRFDVMTRIPV